MGRRSSGICLAIGLIMLAVLSGCAGKSSNVPGNDTVQSVTLSPASNNISIDLGATNLAFSGTARNGLGQVVPIQVSFVSSNNAALTIAKNGLACAGTWDSLTNPVICHPGVVGVAQVTAVVGGISSAPSTVYVHQHIDSLTVAPLSPQSMPDCFSLNDPNPQFRTWTYAATAFSGGVDITSTVGPISFTPTVGNVLTINLDPQLPVNEVRVTAKDPGITNLVASVGGATSNPAQFTTCLVSSVVLQIQNESGNTLLFTAGGSHTLEATVFDTHGDLVSNPPLTWGSTNPEVASFSNPNTTNGTNAVTAKTNLGGADLFAACMAPSCNLGVLPALPVYSTGGLLLNGHYDPDPQDPAGKPVFGAIAVENTNSKVPTYTAWTTTTGCADAVGCGSAMFSVTTSGSNPIGASVLLPFTPNSLQITHDGSSAYLGSSQGLMIVNGLGGNPTVGTASSQTTPCNVALCGKVLAISPDSKRVVVGDTTTSPNQVYIFSSAGAGVVDLTIPGAKAATFSPDGSKLFILSNTGTGSLFVYSSTDALRQVPLAAPATDAAFAADGSFAYVAGAPANDVTGFTTCDGTDIGSSALVGNPVRLFPLAATTEQAIGSPADQSRVTQDVVAVSPPNIQIVTSTFTRPPLSGNQFACNAPSFTSQTVSPVFSLGQNFSPLYMGMAGAGGQFGAQLIVAAQNVPAVLIFDVNGKTTSALPLANGAFPNGAAASSDGSQIFVAACDAFKDNNPNEPCIAGSVHIVNTQRGGDIQQTPFDNPNTKNSMCTGLDPDTTYCVPDLIAVRPQ